MVMLVLHSLEKVFELLAIDLLSYGYDMNLFYSYPFFIMSLFNPSLFSLSFYLFIIICDEIYLCLFR